MNISAGGDFEQPYLDNSLCQLVEEVVKAGVTVVCAVGNAGSGAGASGFAAREFSGGDLGRRPRRSELTRSRAARHVSLVVWTNDRWFAKTGSDRARNLGCRSNTAANAHGAGSALYAELDAATTIKSEKIILAHAGVDKHLDEARDLAAPLLRQLITIKLREGNVINQHYKFVDGTSFASPIVASIVACMLEANPKLTPQQIKRILIETAERVPEVEVDRQGWGVVVPRKAVEMALRCRG